MQCLLVLLSSWLLIRRCSSQVYCGIMISELNPTSPAPDAKAEFIELKVVCPGHLPDLYRCRRSWKYIGNAYHPIVLKGNQYEGLRYAAVAFVSLAQKRTNRKGYFVVGNHPRSDMKPGDPNFILFPRARTSSRLRADDDPEEMTNIFPDGDDYSVGVVLVKGDASMFAPIREAVQQGTYINRHHIRLIANHVIDMTVYGRRASYTGFGVFSDIYTGFRPDRFVLRDYDTVGRPDLSLNFCPGVLPVTPFSPERFKAGVPSPGDDNDCTKDLFYLEHVLRVATHVHPRQNQAACAAPLPFRSYIGVRDDRVVAGRDTFLAAGRPVAAPTLLGIVQPACGEVEDAFEQLLDATTDQELNETIVQPNRHLTYEQKLFVVKLAAYFGRVRRAQGDPSAYAAARSTSIALGVPYRTVRHILQLHREGKLKPKEKTKRPSIAIDGFLFSVIRTVFLGFFTRQSPVYPTVDRLLTKMKEKNEADPNLDFPPIGLETFRKLLRHHGWRWRKVDTKRVYYEQPRIIAQRRDYLKAIKRLRDQGYTVVYQDETWVNERDTPTKNWVRLKDPTDPYSDVEGGIKVPAGAGRRLIVNHAGSENGFVQGAEEVFKAKSGSGDYHQEMNIRHWMEWFENALVKDVPDKTVIVVDNAKYHNAITDDTKNPTTQWRKAEIQDWLRRRNVPFENDMIRPQLLQLARRHHVPPKYKTDELVEKLGRDVKVLRLPIGHSELNPIELIWSQVKRQVKERNKLFTLAEVERLTKERLAAVTAADWQTQVNHVKRVEQRFWDKDRLMDDIVQPLIVPVEDSDDDDDDEDTQVSIEL